MPQANEMNQLHRAVIDAFEHTAPSKWQGIIREVLERNLEETKNLFPVQTESPPEGFARFLEEYVDWKRLIGPIDISNGQAYGRHFWTKLIQVVKIMPIDELQPYATECAAMLMRETINTFNRRPLSQAEELNDAGFERHHVDEYEDAIRLHDQAIALEPQFSLAWINKGIALKNTGRLDQAIACYDHVIKNIDPEYKKAWHNKGVALKMKGDMKGAIECFDKALELDPDYAIAKQAREACLAQQPGKSIQSGMQLPKNEQALRLMHAAAELANRGNWGAASKLYSQAKALEPDNAWLLTLLGEALVENNQIPEAQDLLQQAIELDANNGMAWLNLMRCYLPSQQFTEALEAADRACELMPDFPMAWANRSSALLGLSRFEESLNAARKSLQLDSRNYVALYNLGVSLWKLKKPREALETLEMFIEWYPHSPACESAISIRDWLRSGRT